MRFWALLFAGCALHAASPVIVSIETIFPDHGGQASVCYSPDCIPGQEVAFDHQQDSPYKYQGWIVGKHGENPHCITCGIEGVAGGIPAGTMSGNFTWSREGKWLWFIAQNAGSNAQFPYNIPGWGVDYELMACRVGDTGTGGGHNLVLLTPCLKITNNGIGTVGQKLGALRPEAGRDRNIITWTHINRGDVDPYTGGFGYHASILAWAFYTITGNTMTIDPCGAVQPDQACTNGTYYANPQCNVLLDNVCGLDSQINPEFYETGGIHGDWIYAETVIAYSSASRVTIDRYNIRTSVWQRLQRINRAWMENPQPIPPDFNKVIFGSSAWNGQIAHSNGNTAWRVGYMLPFANAYGWMDIYSPNDPKAPEYLGPSKTPAATGRTTWIDATHFIGYINPKADPIGSGAYIVNVTVKWPTAVLSGRQSYSGKQTIVLP